MTDAAVVHPLPLRSLLPWVALAPVFLLVLYLTGYDQGAVSQAGTVLHELMHDGRHLLAGPCH